MDPLHIAPSLLQELIGKLTPRQVEIVTLLAQGKTIRETSTILSIHPTTVKSHIQRMCNKLQLENRLQLIIVYVRWHDLNL
jgi:DNA-binding CsgD family transcriptional regulator